MDNEKEMAAKALNRSNLCPERTFRVEDFQKIGKGSCSNVFAVNYGYPVGNVVVKLLNRGVNNSGEVLYRQFCLTMDGKLSPYLLPTFYTDDNIIIIEHFNGKDLETRLKSGNPQELNLLRSAIEKNYLNLIEGVKSLHDNGIVHRDIKPANMMYNGVKMVFIDFGLAEQIFDGSGLKKKSSRVGTPFYISPELFLMYPTLDLKKSDVWALGLALLESLTGKWLIMNEFIKLNYGTSCGGPAMLSKVFESISSAPREFLNFIRDEIGSIQPPLANQEPWVNLLLGMLNPDPTKRFSVDEALEAAQRIALPQQMLHSSQQYLSPQTQPQQQMQPQPTYPSQPLQNRIGPAQSRQMDLLDPEEQQTPQHYTSQQQQQIYPQGYPYSQVLPSSTSSQQRVPQPQVQNFQYPATQWQTQFPSQPLQNRIGPAQSRQMDLLDPEDKNRKNREEEEEMRKEEERTENKRKEASLEFRKMWTLRDPQLIGEEDEYGHFRIYSGTLDVTNIPRFLKQVGIEEVGGKRINKISEFFGYPSELPNEARVEIKGKFCWDFSGGEPCPMSIRGRQVDVNYELFSISSPLSSRSWQVYSGVPDGFGRRIGKFYFDKMMSYYYEGPFKGNRPTGKGNLRIPLFPGGEYVYEGPCLDGRKHGRGKIISLEPGRSYGQSYECEFENGVETEASKARCGEYSMNVDNGFFGGIAGPRQFRMDSKLMEAGAEIEDQTGSKKAKRRRK